jgi:predicted PolB exonuclease-like 3'-5' exonuclease
MQNAKENAIDIETIPNIALIGSLPEPEVKLGNLVDPAKIKAKIAEAKQEQIEKMALNPFYGRICSYAAFGTSVQKYHTIDEISDAAEIELINELFDLFSVTQNEVPHIITWNGNDFDLPFIFIRAAILNVNIPMGCLRLRQMTKKYAYAPHTDMMQTLSNWGPNRIKLDHAAATFLGEKKLDHDFTKFIEQIETGRSHEIGIYNLKDAELTFRLFEKLQPYLF